MRFAAGLSTGSFLRAVPGVLGWSALSLLATLGLPPPAQGLDPRKALTQLGHDHWTMDDGLPVTSVEVLAQTPDGYLWTGDEEGLARFDGARFTPFNRRNVPGFANHDVRSLAVRREGGLWVGTWRGLFLFQDGRARQIPVIPEDRFVVIESLFEDHRGTLWVGTQGYGVVRLDGGRPVRYGKEAGLPGRIAWALQEDREGSLWIGASGGLARLSGGRIESFVGHPRLPRGTITCFALAPDGSLWIGGIRGLAHYRSGDFRLYTTADGLPHPSVDALAFDRDGVLWVGTRGGLARFHDGTFSHLGIEDGLADSVVRSLFVDAEGSLWIGTESGGLERLRDGRFTVFGRPEGLVDDLVLAILKDRRGALWFGTKRGLTRLDGGRATTWTQRDGLVVPIVTALYEDHGGTIWVGTTNGLHHFESGRFVPFAPGGELFNTYVNSMWEDPRGILWVATDDGLVRLSEEGLRIFTSADGMSCEQVNVLEPDLAGGLWIGASGGGLMHFQNGRFTVFGPGQGLAEIDVFSLYQDPDGTLWIGTNGGGLNVLRKGRMHTVSTRHGLFDDVILQIVDDRLGFLWLASSRGVSRVEKARILDLLEGRRSSVPTTVYDTADGLRSAELMGGGFRAADGRLWFSTLRGAAVVDPRRLGLDLGPPQVHIEQFLVDGEPAGTAAGLRLPPGSRRLEIVYTAPTFIAPHRVRFRVKLEGFDRDWVEMGNRRAAVYTNLPPGDYGFRVMAANADGVWSRRDARFGFELRPRFYQTSWFYVLAALVAGAGAWGLHGLRLRTMRARLAAVLAERTRIARELHDSLAQELLAASRQLELAAEEMPESPVTARDRLARGQALVASGLAAARRAVTTLRAPVERRDALPAALLRLAEGVTGNGRIEVRVEPEAWHRRLPDSVEENLLGIAREALANALRHARAPHIRVELGNGGGDVRLRVTDDGLGFEETSLPLLSTGHFGIVGMRERARAMGGDLKVKSAPGHGTVVEAVWGHRGGRR